MLKLGIGPQGIFGVGTITGAAKQNPTALPKQNTWQVPITFHQLVDPTEKLLSYLHAGVSIDPCA